MKNKMTAILFLAAGLSMTFMAMTLMTLSRGISLTDVYRDLVNVVNPTTPEDVAAEVVRLINIDRETMGLTPFVINDQLMRMAQVRSDDMVAGNYAGHNSPPGHPSVKDLTEQLGYNIMQTPMENIALVPIPEGRLDIVAEKAVNAWRASPGHWAWVTDEYYWMIGVGVTVDDEQGHVIVTQLFWGPNGVTPSEARRYNREAP